MQNIRKRAGSTSSTTCSTPPPHDIYTVLISEEQRYMRKGYGLISANLIAFSYIFLAPVVVAYVWPGVLRMIEENQW